MWWNSNNPMKEQIELVEKRQKAIMERLGINDDTSGIAGFHGKTSEKG